MPETKPAASASHMTQSVVTILSQHEKRTDISPGVIDRLAKARQLGEQLFAEIKAIEEWIPLTKAYQHKPEAHVSRIEGEIRSKKLDSLVEHSRLLTAIYRSGTNIRSIYGFSAAEMRLAKSVGEFFAEFMDHLAAFRRATPSKTADSGEYTFVTKWSPELRKFLKVLTDQKAIKIVQTIFLVDGKWRPFNKDWFKSSQEGKDFRIFFDVLDKQKKQFLSGDWLTAFVYDIAVDHLRRNIKDHEVFAKVSFRAPTDVSRVASDFDVIARVGQKILCFECKSGRLNDDRVNFNIMKQKTADMTAIFKRFLGDEYQCLFYLVFDPTNNKAAEVTEKLAGSHIEPLVPNRVRELIFDVLPTN
jgi:hypothetical protein